MMRYSSRESDLKRRCILTVSPLYEVFYALSVLCDRESRIHRTWAERARKRLPAEFHRLFESVGADPFLWTVLPDVLGIVLTDVRFEEILSTLEGISHHDFTWRILEGIFHSGDVAEQLAAHEISLEQAVLLVPSQKQEWLAHIGLFPFDSTRPTAKMLQTLLDDPVTFRRSVSMLLSIFWRDIFAGAWNQIAPQAQRLIVEKERLFEACSLQEFATQSLLRIEADEKNGHLKAIRGGYIAPYNRIERLYFLPSAFNDKRLWSAFEEPDGGIVAYLPYFEPTISLDQMDVRSSDTFAEPEVDPALVFKALGDTTRYAIAKIIAKSEHSSADLAKILRVSRATITHHIYLLREAGLIAERPLKGATLLRLRREAIEHLSQLAIAALFDGLPGE